MPAVTEYACPVHSPSQVQFVAASEVSLVPMLNPDQTFLPDEDLSHGQITYPMSTVAAVKNGWKYFPPSGLRLSPLLPHSSSLIRSVPSNCKPKLLSEPRLVARIDIMKSTNTKKVCFDASVLHAHLHQRSHNTIQATSSVSCKACALLLWFGGSSLSPIRCQPHTLSIPRPRVMFGGHSVEHSR